MSAAPIPFIDPSEAQQGQGAPPAGPPQPQPVPQPAAPPEQAPAPEGAPAPAAPSPAAGAAAGGQAGPQANPSGGWGQRTLHGILKALDGTQDVAYQVDPQSGQMVASHVDNGPGSMAKRIIAGAVTGLAAGASAAPGPGHIQRGLAAGIGAGAQGAQARDEQARADALGNYQRLDQSKMRNAQLALTNQQLLASTHTMNREDVAAAEHYTDSYNQWEQMVGSGPENVSLGIIKPKPGQTLAQATTAAIAANPQVLALHAKGQTLFHPVVTDGKVSGYAAAIVTPAWKDQLNDKPHTYYSLRQNPKTGELETETQTIPAGAEKNGVIALHDEALLNKGNELSSGKYTSDQTAKTARLDTQARTGAELGAARIGANSREQVAQMELNANGGGGGGQLPDYNSLSPAMQQTIQKLAHYDVDPGTFSNSPRKGTGQMSRAVAIGLASQLNPDYDDKQYKTRSAYMKGMVGDGKGAATVRSLNTAIGHLDTLAGDNAKLNNSQFPIANAPVNAIESHIFGDQRQGNQRQAADALAGELTTAFRNTGGSLTEVENWRKGFSENGSKPQQTGSTTQAAALLGSRINAFGQQYTDTMGGKRPFRLLNDHSRTVLHKMGLDNIVALDDAGYSGTAGGMSRPGGNGQGAAPSGNVQQGAAPQGGLSVTDPNGGVHSFPNQQAADAFRKAAGIK